MSLCRSILLTAMCILMALLVSPAAAQEETRVKARLVAGTSAVEAGSTFWLGVQFEIEDGWHIYWRNPGGAGLATDVRFELPDGLVAGPLQWPLPIAFVQSEGIPGYGYEGSVVLAAAITAPPDVDISALGKVRAEASWLACKGVCVLGSAELGAFAGRAWRMTRCLVRGPVGYRLRPKPGDLPFSLSVTGGPSDGSRHALAAVVGRTGSRRVVPKPVRSARGRGCPDPDPWRADQNRRGYSIEKRRLGIDCRAAIPVCRHRRRR